MVTAEMIAAARELFKDQSGPYTEAQLLAIPADQDLPGSESGFANRRTSIRIVNWVET